MTGLTDRIASKYRQLYLKLTGTRSIVCSRYGSRFRLNMDKIVDYRFYLDEFERGNLEYFLSQISRDDVVIDVGANIGIYAILAAARTGRSGNVIAFEPAEKAFAGLTGNIALNGYTNIIAVNKGVSDSTKQMTFTVCEDDAYNSLGNAPMQEATGTVTIDTVSLDEYALEHDLRRIDVIKVDTEGAEYLVFKGAEEILRKFRPKLFFEFNPYTAPGFAFDPYEAVNFLRGLGYTFMEFVDGKPETITGNTLKTCDIIGIPPKNG